ncbi:diguanylate cyclase [Massilia violaceinigra]|uniref:diguanylate cyclase n=1 Tax=Massilia violaceinigra TaxID=2045208 RepID=A0ABY4A3C4_9BURK|nr:diguanylate cyclase [Massilia violaceinigra]UOD29269.1 diguanylate cyclase [Massilia violaceinigra]
MNADKPVRLLVVDDQPIIIEHLELMLEDSGVVCEYVTDPLHAVDVALRFRPTVILQDLVMPTLDGIELMGRYRETLELESVPIIVLSADDDAFQKEQCFLQGANDYLVKLPHRVELLARIRYHSKAYLANMERDEAFHCLQVSQERLGAANVLLQKLNGLDGLTGIANRRKFDEQLAVEWQRAKRNKYSLALLMCDIDHFKQYNDTYGHQGGDQCLKRVAAVLTEQLNRPGDLVARYGGEEFAVILPDTTIEGAVHIANRCLQHLEALRIENKGVSPTGYLTISVGAAVACPGKKTAIGALIEAADRALYAAKHRGRNTVCAAHCPPSGENDEVPTP